jgi:hypothetical protein
MPGSVAGNRERLAVSNRSISDPLAEAPILRIGHIDGTPDRLCLLQEDATPLMLLKTGDDIRLALESTSLPASDPKR